VTSPAISIITATYNAAATVADCLQSVANQTHPCEHIIIDGASIDSTLEVVRRISPSARILSEPDKGIYDAMNKGIALATGDIVGILNADDFYVDSLVLEKVTTLFRDSGADVIFADLLYVRPDNLEKVVRYYSGANFTPEKFAWGCMPPHPTFFVRRELYDLYGLFHTDYRIAADFELAARFLFRYRVRYAYLPEVVVRMRTGGVSTRNFMSNWILNQEILRACAENGINTNFFKIYFKYFTKIMQLFRRPE
jgi:glycosyltransferase involved in cell wall biosynthesis